MGKIRNKLLFINMVILLSLCACFTTRKAAVTAPAPAAPAAGNDNITFINGIDIHREGRATRHRVPMVNTGKKEMPADTAALADAPSVQTKYAQLLGVALNDISDITLYDFINEWWGTPYRYGGDSHDGIDCSAFVQLLYAAVFHITDLPRTSQEQYASVKKIRHKDRLEEGDLVFFHIRTRRISHVGIYLQNNKFVHASLTQGITISDLSDPYWHRYYVCGGKVDENTGS